MEGPRCTRTLDSTGRGACLGSCIMRKPTGLGPYPFIEPIYRDHLEHAWVIIKTGFRSTKNYLKNTDEFLLITSKKNQNRNDEILKLNIKTQNSIISFNELQTQWNYIEYKVIIANIKNLVFYFCEKENILLFFFIWFISCF